MKIRLVGAELFHAHGRTDMTKLIDAFRNYCERAQKMSAEDHFRENRRSDCHQVLFVTKSPRGVTSVRNGAK
jgi:hypothetical protein